MKRVILKKSVMFPVTLEIAPYVNRLFIPGEVVKISDQVYANNKSSFFDIAQAEKVVQAEEVTEDEDVIIEFNPDEFIDGDSNISFVPETIYMLDEEISGE